VYYGICDARLADPTKAKKPIQGHFGNKDTMAGFSDPAVYYCQLVVHLRLRSR